MNVHDMPSRISNARPLWVPRLGAQILQEVAEDHGLTVSDLKGRNKKAAYAWPRQLAMLRIYDETSLSMPQIGRLMGNRDHTTILYGMRAAERRIRQGLQQG